MTTRTLSLSALLLVLTALPTRAQTGEDILRYSQRFPAVDTRMTGMAGAAVGGIGDWGATYANPAGLGLVRRSHVVGAISAGSVQSEARYFGDVSEATETQTALGSAAYVAALPTLRGSFVLGVGYNQTAGFDRELAFAGFNENAAFDSGTGLRQFGQLFEDGVSGELSLVGAVEVAPRVMAGLSLNVIAGDYQFQQVLDEVARDGTPVFSTGDFLEADLRGANLRGGVSAEVSPGVRLGLTLESPTLYRVEERSDLFTTGQFDYSISTPWRVSGGLVYELAGVILAADLEFLDWSQARLRPTDEFRPPFTETDRNLDIRSTYREVLNTRFGAEYAIGPWAVRAGAAFQPDPLREELDLRGIDADRLRSTYTVGFSLETIDRVAIDVAYAYTEFEDVLVPYSVVEGGVIVDEPLVTEDVARNRFLVGVRVDL
jgi:long-subunit fatty acid transport protein